MATTCHGHPIGTATTSSNTHSKLKDVVVLLGHTAPTTFSTTRIHRLKGNMRMMRVYAELSSYHKFFLSFLFDLELLAKIQTQRGRIKYQITRLSPCNPYLLIFINIQKQGALRAQSRACVPCVHARSTSQVRVCAQRVFKILHTIKYLLFIFINMNLIFIN